jgi:hypothetical protein
MNKFATSVMAIGMFGASQVSQALPPRQQGNAILPRTATEGQRDLKTLQSKFSKIIRDQPFGKKWKDIVATEAAPKNGAGLGKAQTHPNLKFDPIELQEQSQYVANVGDAARYGWLSMRLRRVYRYGRLLAAQIVIEPIGDPQKNKEALNKDVAAIKLAWAKPMKALGLGKAYALVFNDLTGKRLNKSWTIQIEPRGSQ